MATNFWRRKINSNFFKEKRLHFRRIFQEKSFDGNVVLPKISSPIIDHLGKLNTHVTAAVNCIINGSIGLDLTKFGCKMSPDSIIFILISANHNHDGSEKIITNCCQSQNSKMSSSKAPFELPTHNILMIFILKIMHHGRFSKWTNGLWFDDLALPFLPTQHFKNIQSLPQRFAKIIFGQPKFSGSARRLGHCNWLVDLWNLNLKRCC